MLLGKTVYAALGEKTNTIRAPQSLNESKSRPQTAKANVQTKITLNPPKEKKIYTHIHTDPVAIIKQHVEERMKTTKNNQTELLNLTKTSNNLNNLNKSNSISMMMNKSTQPFLHKTEAK